MRAAVYLLLAASAAAVGCRSVVHTTAYSPSAGHTPSDYDLLSDAPPAEHDDPSTSPYQLALTRLVTDALHAGRLHPQRGLTLCTPAGEVVVPVRYVGMTWHPEEVGELQPTDAALVKKHLKHHHTRPGWGVPVVGLSREAGLRGPAERFTNAFPHGITLTSVLRPGPQPVLELIDASHADTVDLGGVVRPLAADLSAPLALAAQRAEEMVGAEPQNQFRTPRLDAGYNRLVGLEPYRPGTFPLVFVHGANSDNFTWLDTINDLRIDPDFTRRFQVMTYRYATGVAFPEATADLRDQGAEFVRASDPAGTDAALRQWVLVGYSLGGPVCRLAVSSSGAALWGAFSSTPFDDMVLTDRGRTRLRRLFFFEPMPEVRTCVLIGSPNDGGTPVSNTLFRLAAWGIRYPREDRQGYRRMLRKNPGAIRWEARVRIPTSLDTISHNNWLLGAARGLPIPCDVRVHTILGDGWMGGRSDRVVPVASARDPRADTETVIDMLHKDGQKHPLSLRRQLEILDEHAARFGQPR